MSKPNLPELPSPLKEIAWLGGRPQDVYGRAEMIAYAEEAVRQALAAQAETLQEAFDDGWREAAAWAERDYLFADMDSFAYTTTRARCLGKLSEVSATPAETRDG